MTVGVVIPVIDIDLHFLEETLKNFVDMKPCPDVITIVHDGKESVGEFTKWLMAQHFEDGRVKYIRLHQEPMGTGKSVNAGISVTETDWIIVTCADDIPKPYFVQKVIESDQSCDIIAVAYNVVTHGSAATHLVQPRRVTPENVREGNIGIPELSPFKRHLWERFKFDEDPDNHMDGALFFLQCILDNAKVGYVKEPCMDFLKRPDSKWARNAHKESEIREAMLVKAGLRKP